MPAPRATWTITAVSIDHYENFPVASVLCPPALRPAVTAIYWFARTADDIADEGDADTASRLAELSEYRADLLAMLASGAPSLRWPKVFAALNQTLQTHALPPALLLDLLSAFEQDVHKHSYADRAELLDYCRRSANPVGRLLLHLYGVSGGAALRQSDAICTALQLVNFWQDRLRALRHEGIRFVAVTRRNARRARARRRAHALGTCADARRRTTGSRRSRPRRLGTASRRARRLADSRQDRSLELRHSRHTPCAALVRRAAVVVARSPDARAHRDGR
jgi:squalene synthase HpnC